MRRRQVKIKNPRAFEKKDLFFLPGGRGHYRGYFYVKDIQERTRDIPDYSAPWIPGKGYTILKTEKYTVILGIRCAKDDGSDSNGRTEFEFDPEYIQLVTTQYLNDEEKSIISALEDKNNKLRKIMEDLSESEV